MDRRFIRGLLGLALLGGCSSGGGGSPQGEDGAIGGGSTVATGGGVVNAGGQPGQGGSGQGGSIPSRGGSSPGVGGWTPGVGGSGRGGSPQGPGGSIGYGGTTVVGLGGAFGGAAQGGSGLGGQGVGGSCSAGTTLCDGACVDTTVDPENCGRCGNACPDPQVCLNSACVADTPTGDDGCSGLAHSIAITKVSMYQAVEIPLMEDSEPVAAADRNAGVVEGRDGVVRVFVELASNWTAREVSVRLNLTRGGTTTTLFDKQTFTESSSDGNLDSTGVIEVSKDLITADTEYSVEIVECTSSTGTITSPRAPADGTAALGAEPTGPIKIALVPVKIGSYTPDTSEAALSVYRNYVAAMYPITEVQFTITDPITAAEPVDWNVVLDQIFNKRAEDGVEDDVYYFGLLKPADSLAAYCQRSCTAGIGYVIDQITGWGEEADYRVACGLAYADEVTGSTMAHEVGHNQGRDHAPCNVDGDANYPYEGGSIGSWGYDLRDKSMKDPARVPDIMGYCDDPWISDYTYQGMLERVALLNGATAESRIGTAPEQQAWQKLLVSESSARWGSPMSRPRFASGTPELAQIYDAEGNVLTEVTVYRMRLSNPGHYTILVPELEPGWSAIGVSGVEVIAFGE